MSRVVIASAPQVVPSVVVEQDEVANQFCMLRLEGRGLLEEGTALLARCAGRYLQVSARAELGQVLRMPVSADASVDP